MGVKKRLVGERGALVWHLNDSLAVPSWTHCITF